MPCSMQAYTSRASGFRWFPKAKPVCGRKSPQPSMRKPWIAPFRRLSGWEERWGSYKRGLVCLGFGRRGGVAAYEFGKHRNKIGIELSTSKLLESRQSRLRSHSLAVTAVRCHRVERVGNGDDARPD